MFIVKYKNLFFAISAVLVAAALGAMVVKGFNVGIDFKGGSMIEVSYTDARPDIAALEESIKDKFPGSHMQLAGEKDLIVRTKDLSDKEHTDIIEELSLSGANHLTEKQFSSVGPTIGKELRSRAWAAMIAVLLGIVLFIAFAFRKVSLPVSSWKYGLITLVSLVHDVIIPAGIFAYLGKEVNSLFVVALLSILGISVHDKIVVFDRIRENLKLHTAKEFSDTVGKSLEQTFARSINTSLTILIVLGALWYLGPDSTRDFSMLLFAGVAIGTYSSIFFASPLVVLAEKLQIKNRSKK
ncbi:MAG: protein translocase subunit SecF [Candidatus Paceibacterota bacterium]|jgi:preprotein translocase subunit SecF